MINPHRILEAVCDAFGVTKEAIWGPSRTRFLSEPRQMTAFLLRRHTTMSLEDITNFLNRKNHTTCIYWLRRTTHLFETQKMYRQFVEHIEGGLHGPRTETKTEELRGAGAFLPKRPRYTQGWHRLQWLLQRLPQQDIANGDQGEGESGRDPEADHTA